jgi:hypothetical protein
VLNPRPTDYCRLSSSEKSRLIVVVDAEEEFDWTRDFSRYNSSVNSAKCIGRIQDVFDEYHITPVYVVDYPIASQPEGYRPFQEILASGRCVIGAHLHPWVNPPFEEAVNRYNSFPGNLPRALESTKLRILGECIQERFGYRPIIYKAGRFGIGVHTAEILEEEGYEIDLSVCPHMDYSAEGGPDFSCSSVWPYWFGNRSLLELPLTVGFAGLLRRWGPTLHRITTHSPMTAVHAAGISARLRLVNKIWLSPEGYTGDELIALVRMLHRTGLRIFSFGFHSPSLDFGCTPYVRSTYELDVFIYRCRRFFDYFMGDLGGIPATPQELRAQLSNRSPVER